LVGGKTKMTTRKQFAKKSKKKRGEWGDKMEDKGREWGGGN